MESYMNLGGDSGVVAFEIRKTLIRVQFSDGSVYRYTYASAGSSNIKEMKRLARQGEGLNGFINSVVRNMYERREIQQSRESVETTAFDREISTTRLISAEDPEDVFPRSQITSQRDV